MRSSTLAAALAASILAVGCVDVSPEEGQVGFTTRDSVLHLGADDARVVSTDGQLELALVGERVLMRMSDQAIARLKQELDTAKAASQAGVGSWIEKRVKGAVQKVMDKQMVMPVSSIADARYEQGEIRIILQGSKDPISFPGRGEAKAKAEFPREDAERFVEAVRAARERRT
ncbi:MAG TPA: hypothetical protein VEA99_05715 [Gemmatimonadaceae bacterium]|nr:hypothetical protein [Gemmatimonadaceae bacterium]